MVLAKAERDLIQSHGSHHEATKEARKAFSAAWEQVKILRNSFGLPSHIKEDN